ncbi:hypothetical protein CGRA01v4_09639 [Colletotrichum graminicola]|nr:hypothetical protein CGRA01v4_09639 [Colletotrichum graminicola]
MMPSALRLQLPSSRPQVAVHPRTVSDAGRDCHFVPEAWSSIAPSLIPTRAALRETMRRRLGRFASDDSLSDLQEAPFFSSMGPRVGLLASSCPIAAFSTPLSASSFRRRCSPPLPFLGDAFTFPTLSRTHAIGIRVDHHA